MNFDYDGPTSLTFILPTTGRPSLQRAIDSILSQPLAPQDVVLVVGDFGTPGWLAALFESITPIYRIRTNQGNNWGHHERRVGMRYAVGSHLVFVDDDDALLPGAVRAIRRATDRHPRRPIMFRMIDPNGAILWADPEVRMGNHGTPCFVPPNIPSLLGTWTDRYEADFDFVTSTLEKYPPSSLVWDTSVIYGCRTYGGA